MDTSGATYEELVTIMGHIMPEPEIEIREGVTADLSARPLIDHTEGIDENDLLHPNPPWEIEYPSRYRSMGDVSFSAHPEHAKAITVLAYHLWQLEERLTGGDGSHKSCDPIRIGYDRDGWFNTYSYVFPEIDNASFSSLERLEQRLLEMFAYRMTNLLANGRKRESVKW